MMRAVAKAARNSLRAGILWQAPGHYYSPATSRSDRRRQVEWDASATEVPGVDLNPEGHERMAAALAPHLASCEPRRWTPDNGWFSRADATVLHCFLAEMRPGRIVEVGSGYSTAVMLDAADSVGTTRDITCIEPHPARLRSIMRPEDTPRIVKSPLQDVLLEEFTSLKDRDLLFIDSTHVAKAGSDVLRLYLEILPRLNPGVLIHVHDIFWPFSYHSQWHLEGRDWTEAYLLRALLTESSGWEVVWFGSYVWNSRSDLAAMVVPFPENESPGSIYLRRLGPSVLHTRLSHM